jgi:AAA family ATP:ADP antiporter
LALGLLDKIVTFRKGEAATAWLMFAYSFLAMTSYNIVKPITKAKFISELGVDNLPYILLAASVLIGVLMQLYSRVSGRLSRRAIIPVTLAGLVALLVSFWLLLRTGAAWVPVAFFVFGLIFGSLVISQFWTLANDIYDSRQARRLFGFIGGGASLGGAMGNGLTAIAVKRVGEDHLLLASAGALALCLVAVMAIVRRQPVTEAFSPAAEERGVGGGEAIRLLRQSRHLQIIALVIGIAALGATIIEQQLYMAADAALSETITEFLAKVGFYLSLVSFVVQVGLTSRIHRSAGLAFALLLLPVSLGTTGVITLLTGALWAPAAARMLDTSLRYSIDKTTREVLFLPLPADLKYRAKPFVDVTMDRFARAAGALLVLVLIKPWGLHFDWRRLSYASLVVTAVWIVLAFVARREYLRAFRRSLGAREMEPAAVRVDVADAATIETLVEELSSPDDTAVLYAIEMLEALDKRHLIPPLLLYHGSPKVRARALVALEVAPTDLAERWIPAVYPMLKDVDADVRAAAVHALAVLRKEEAPTLMHGYLEDAEPRVSATAAVVLADSGVPADARAAEAALTRLGADTRDAAAAGRREAAAALARIRNPAFRSLLIPLIHDRDPGVAGAAIGSARAIGASDWLFVPALVARLGHRQLKSAARDALVSYGGGVIDVLAHFLCDRGEHAWVRRHVPATLARFPTQRSMDALFAALDDPDGFLRYKIIEAIETLHRDHPDLAFTSATVEALVFRESARYFTYLTLRHHLVQQDAAAPASLLVRALDDKLARTLDRLYRLLGLVYPWKDIADARYSIEHGDARTHGRALEYLDNRLSGAMRKRVMPIIDDAPMVEKVRHANRVLRTRPRDLEDTVAQLVHDDDPVVAASAIDLVETHGLGSLAGDLEYVLAHRSAEPLVIEAAAWALASRGRAGPGPGPNLAHLPVVKLADRLRAIPLFDFVSVDELFRIAGIGQQRRYERGEDFSSQGAPADAVQFLLDGSVGLTAEGAAPAVIRAPAALAFEEVLEGRALRSTITAIDAVVCLRLDGADFLTMLSDNTVLAQGLFRMLLASPGAREWSAVHLAPGRTASSGPRSRPLYPVEKALRLRESPLLGRATVEQLLDLVAIAREVPLSAGAVLFSEDEPPAVYHVVEGEVRLEADQAAPILVGAGSTIGVAETLAGVSRHWRATVSHGGHALRLDRDELFGVLADHTDLLQGLFSGVLSRRA